MGYRYDSWASIDDRGKQKRKKRTADSLGRTRTKLAALIEEFGFEVDPYEIHRIYSTEKLDLARWYVDVTAKGHKSLPDGFGVHLYSWDTMTECAACGINLTEEMSFQWEVSANYVKKKVKDRSSDGYAFKYINQYYGLNVKPGDRVRQYEGKEGVVVGADNAYLLVRLDKESYVGRYHPTWKMTYL